MDAIKQTVDGGVFSNTGSGGSPSAQTGGRKKKKEKRSVCVVRDDFRSWLT